MESKSSVVQNLEFKNKDLKVRIILNIDFFDSVSNESQRSTTEIKEFITKIFKISPKWLRN